MTKNNIKETFIKKASDRLVKTASNYAVTLCHGYCYEPQVPSTLLAQQKKENL